MGRRRSVPPALLLFLIVLVAAAGCTSAGIPAAVEGTGGSGDAVGSEESNSSDAASALERTAEPTAPPESDAEPPGSTLGSGDRAVAGVLGSYCWSSGSGNTVVQTCVDAAYNPVSGERETLAVPAGSEMVFDYGGEGPPDAVRARAEPLGPEGEWAGPSRPLVTGGSGGGRVTISAEVPAGVYVVEVFVQVPEGDASYYFRVVVEGDGAALPAAGGPEERFG